MPSYYQTARENEEVFRNILKEIRENSRGMDYFPQDLGTEASLDEIFKKYSKGFFRIIGEYGEFHLYNFRNGKFTILNFTRPSEDKATIKFEKRKSFLDSINPFNNEAGHGAELKFLVNSDNSVKYDGWKSLSFIGV